MGWRGFVPFLQTDRISTSNIPRITALTTIHVNVLRFYGIEQRKNVDLVLSNFVVF